MVDCPHADRCGGCALIALSSDAQHAFKRERVGRAFGAYRTLAEAPVRELVTAETNTSYRTRAKLVVSSRGEIGLYARGGHDVVDIPECRVLSARLSEVAAALRKLPIAPLTGVDLRETYDGSQYGVLVTLIAPPRARATVAALADQVAAIEGVLGVAWSARHDDSAQVLGRSPEALRKEALVRDRLLDDGPYVYAAHGGFAQAHRAQATKLVGQVVQELRAALGGLHGKHVLELYAGAGALALRLASEGAHVTAVERYAPSLEHLTRAACEQHLTVPECIADDAEVALDRLARQRRAASAQHANARGAGAGRSDAGSTARHTRELANSAPERQPREFDASVLTADHALDAIVVNPPRRGLPARVRSLIAQLAPRVVVYVSCDPDTLSRDLADFAHQGLRTRSLTPYDLMPLAADVESVVTLEPAPPPSAAILHEDDDLLIVDKPPHVPTHPEREHATSLLEQLQRARNLPELRPVHRLDLGTSGICIFAKSGPATTAAAAALAAGTKHYLALVKGRVHVKGIVKQPLDGAESLTRYTRKQLLGGHSLVRVRPAQGRTHQVRRHLAAIGHPVLGDARYGDPASNRYFEHRHGLDRAFLHLGRLELTAPSGAALQLEAPLSPDLEAVLRSLK